MTTVIARKVAEHPAIHLSDDLDRALSTAAKDLNLSRASIVHTALVEYLQDLADSKALAEARAQGGELIAFADLRRELDL